MAVNSVLGKTDTAGSSGTIGSMQNATNDQSPSTSTRLCYACKGDDHIKRDCKFLAASVYLANSRQGRGQGGRIEKNRPQGFHNYRGRGGFGNRGSYGGGGFYNSGGNRGSYGGRGRGNYRNYQRNRNGPRGSMNAMGAHESQGPAEAAGDQDGPGAGGCQEGQGSYEMDSRIVSMAAAAAASAIKEKDDLNF